MSKRRKRVPDVAAVQTDGIREVVMTLQGRRVVVRVNDREGTQHIDRLAEDEPEVLTHSFPNCSTCHGQHLSVDGEPAACPRTGWGWAQGIPSYPNGARVLQDQVDEASIFNRSVSRDLNIIAREIERRGGPTV
jgi:hypothetical protein